MNRSFTKDEALAMLEPIVGTPVSRSRVQLIENCGELDAFRYRGTVHYTFPAIFTLALILLGEKLQFTKEEMAVVLHADTIEERIAVCSDIKAKKEAELKKDISAATDIIELLTVTRHDMITPGA